MLLATPVNHASLRRIIDILGKGLVISTINTTNLVKKLTLEVPI